MGSNIEIFSKKTLISAVEVIKQLLMESWLHTHICCCTTLLIIICPFLEHRFITYSFYVFSSFITKIIIFHFQICCSFNFYILICNWYFCLLILSLLISFRHMIKTIGIVILMTMLVEVSLQWLKMHIKHLLDCSLQKILH